jgi:hypothetical protein
MVEVSKMMFYSLKKFFLAFFAKLLINKNNNRNEKILNLIKQLKIEDFKSELR